MKYRILILVCVLTGLHLPVANAVENFQFSGYMTVMGTYAKVAKKANPQEYTKYDNGYASDKLDLDPPGNTIGLQVSADVTDKLDVTLVLQAHGNDEIDAEWAYANYSATDNLTLRLGRFKGSFFMVSEYSTVSFAYPWVTLPHEVYSTDLIESIAGLNLVYQTSVGSGNWLFEVYTGSANHGAKVLPTFIDSPANSCPTCPKLSKGDMVDFSANQMVGFNTTIGTKEVTFRAGYFTTDMQVPSYGITKSRVGFGGVGLIVDWRNILVYSEYVARDTSSELAYTFPDQKAWYTTLGYRFGDFMPYITIGGMDKGKDNSVYAVKQSSATLGFRYELGATSAIKFEAQQVKTDSDPGDTGRYGLFDDPVKNGKGNIFAASFDVVF